MTKLTKEQALEKIKELEEYIEELEQNPQGHVIIRNRHDGSKIYVSKANNIRDAVVEAVKEGVNLSDANLWEADLSEANLSDANLREADLCKANLRRADLSGADLWGADLSGADLWGANLSGAELENAKFYGKGGTQRLTKEQVPVFLKALGFEVED